MPYFLYVEDDRDDVDILQDVMATHFQKIGLICVPGGFELLQHLERVPRNASYPLLILLDWSLPRMEGRETLKLLKCDDFFRLLPVAVLTTAISDTERDYCRSMGTEVFLKPDHPEGWMPILALLREYSEG